MDNLFRWGPSRVHNYSVLCVQFVFWLNYPMFCSIVVTQMNYLLPFIILGAWSGLVSSQQPNGTQPSFVDETVDDGTPFDLNSLVEPSRPSLTEEGIGEDHFNISFVPGEYDDEEQRPVGNKFYARVREEGDTDWKVGVVRFNYEIFRLIKLLKHVV